MAPKNSSGKKNKNSATSKPTKKMTAIEAELALTRAAVKKLKSAVQGLEQKVTKAEKKADGLKSEVKKLRAEAVIQAKKIKKASKVAQVRKRGDAIVDHDELATPVAAQPEVEDVDSVAPDDATPEVADPEVADPKGAAADSADQDPAPASSAPSVAQLRALAREKGVPGYSRMRKEQLISALS